MIANNHFSNRNQTILFVLTASVLVTLMSMGDVQDSCTMMKVYTDLQTLDTIGNCQRLAFTVGVSQHA